MLKTITVFKIADLATAALLNAVNLSAELDEPTAADPDKTQWARAGFSALPNSEHTVYVAPDGVRLFNVQIRERILPGKVIRNKLAERVADIEERQGRRCGPKEIMGLKDEVTAELLPVAFIRRTDILCMIIKDYLIINTGSAKVVDECLGQLRAAYPDDPLKLMPIISGRDTKAWMSELLLTNTTKSGLFNLADSLVLKGAEKQTTRFKGVDLESRAVVDSVSDGQSPVEIAATFNERVTFSLADTMILKRIKFLDVLLKDATESAEDAADAFDATLAIISGEIVLLLDALLSEIPDTLAKPATTTNDEDDEL